MSKDHRLTCAVCQHQWIGTPYDQQYTEKCPECDSEEFEIGREYRQLNIREALWLVLLIPNFLLFVS